MLEGVTEPDVVFFSGGKRVDAAEYESLLGRSRFCLAPYGHGWGMRLSHALMHGCVPVVLQDRVRQVSGRAGGKGIRDVRRTGALRVVPCACSSGFGLWSTTVGILANLNESRVVVGMYRSLAALLVSVLCYIGVCAPVTSVVSLPQPWEDLLHYPDFSIRVGKRELHRLVPLLRAIPDEDVARLMRESNAVYRAFLWQPELGGLAYNYTIASLRRRLSHIRGELYEAGT